MRNKNNNNNNNNVEACAPAEMPRTEAAFLEAQMQAAREDLGRAFHQLTGRAKTIANPVAWLRHHPLLVGAVTAGLATWVGVKVARRMTKNKETETAQAPAQAPAPTLKQKAVGAAVRLTANLARAFWQGFMGIFVTRILNPAATDSSAVEDSPQLPAGKGRSIPVREA